ncbi:IS110 family transposase [Pseudomonas sp.]|uniref:IS110 family transposase n=1 Tax=Pseudomonas sp. TaxID=306 RepID=UPI003BEF2554
MYGELGGYFSIDVSKSKLDVALLRNKKFKSKVVDNTREGHQELLEWLSKLEVAVADVHVCMEATGVYYEPIAIALHASGFKVSVVNPSCIKGFGASENIRNKNDAIDAKLIARYCERMSPSAWVPPPLEQRQLRAWAVRIQSLKDILQQEQNRLEALSVNGMDAISAHIETHITWLRAEIKKLEKDIDDHIDKHPDLKCDAELIGSIPGLGPLTVARILGYVGNVRRFDSAKAFAAYLGVTPKHRTSGTSLNGRTTVSRAGHAALRAALYMPSLVARRHNPILRAFGDRLAASGMAKKAVIGAITHKLAHLIYGVLKTNRPFDPNFLVKDLAVQDSI